MASSTFRHQVIILFKDSTSRIKYPIMFQMVYFKILKYSLFFFTKSCFFEKKTFVDNFNLWKQYNFGSMMFHTTNDEHWYLIVNIIFMEMLSNTLGEPTPTLVLLVKTTNSFWIAYKYYIRKKVVFIIQNIWKGCNLCWEKFVKHQVTIAMCD